MKLLFKNIFFAIVMTFGSVITASAKVTLPSFFTDNMVLQQKATVPFWGQSVPNSTITVISSWNKKKYTVKADAKGNWKTALSTPSYGGPYKITIKDKETLILNNILIGEVWLCSGQSNMEMPLDGWGKINNYEEEIANANYPQIRLLQAEHVDSASPLKDLKVQHGGWQVCSSATIADFSATAYFFAKKIYDEKHIPIGLLHSSWGGTFIEAWISSGALKQVRDFDDDLRALLSDNDKQKMEHQFNVESKVWNIAMEKAERGTAGNWEAEKLKDNSWKSMKLPQLWESDELGELDGVVWFRKEVRLSKNMIGEDITLEFYADDNDKLWINGTFIGETNGYNVKRNYVIPASVWKEKDNVIAIRVTDNGGRGGIYGKENDLLLKAGDISFSLAGDWKYAVGVDYKELPKRPVLVQGQDRPASLYNAMINPIIKLPVAGVIWYQGESNAERAHQYQTLFPLLIKDWRVRFNNKDLPFFYVQLANFMKSKSQPDASAWAELREAQFKTLKVPNTGMAVAVDIGDATDIHPKNKQEVGYRLARIALAKVYGVAIPYSGPLYKSYFKTGNAITITFDFNTGLKADGDVLKGFAVAGNDKVFHWAEAKAVGDSVVVTCKEVKDPISVRYNWADNPNGNLINDAGLPASPFRTDDWEGVTFGKK